MRLLAYLWGFIHNVVAHPIIGIFPCELTDRFHDWTARKWAACKATIYVENVSNHTHTVNNHKNEEVSRIFAEGYPKIPIGFCEQDKIETDGYSGYINGQDKCSIIFKDNQPKIVDNFEPNYISQDQNGVFSIGGVYQPDGSDKIDKSNPPKGGSGLKKV